MDLDSVKLTLLPHLPFWSDSQSVQPLAKLESTLALCLLGRSANHPWRVLWRLLTLRCKKILVAQRVVQLHCLVTTRVFLLPQVSKGSRFLYPRMSNWRGS